MSNEGLPHNIKENSFETNVYNPYQGEFRRSLLDLSLLEYAIQRDRVIAADPEKSLVITCLDHIRDEYRFTRNGQVVSCDNQNNFVEKIAEHLKLKEVFMSASDDSAGLVRLVF